MEKKSKSFNIVIYPPKDIFQKATSVSRRLKRKGGLFVLDAKNYFPHITLYMTEFPLKNVLRIRKLLKQLTSEIKPFSIKSLNYRQIEDGYIDVNYRRSKNIRELQKKIIALLNPLRERFIRKKDGARMRELSKAQQKNIKLYGYRSVGSEFYPHLTFTKLEKFDQSALAGIDKLDFSFKVDKIGFFYLGDYGTCHKLIEILNLA